jgi:hypothetical protein
MKTKPINREWIARFFEAEYLWAASNDDALVVTQFLMKMGVSPSTFAYWVGKYPEEAKRHYDALAVIGARREIGGLKKTYSESIVKFTAPFYDDNWKAIAEMHARLAQIGNTDTGNKQYILLGGIECAADPENNHHFNNKKLTCDGSES